MEVLLVLLAVPYLSDAVSREYLVDSSVAEATLLEADSDDDEALVTLCCRDANAVRSASCQHTVSAGLVHHLGLL